MFHLQTNICRCTSTPTTNAWQVEQSRPCCQQSCTVEDSSPTTFTTSSVAWMRRVWLLLYCYYYQMLGSICVRYSLHVFFKYSPLFMTLQTELVCFCFSGKGAVYSFDPVGSYQRDTYKAGGSASAMLQPLLDNQVKKPKSGISWALLLAFGGFVPPQSTSVQFDSTIWLECLYAKCVCRI